MKFANKITPFLVIDVVIIILVSGIVCLIENSKIGEIFGILIPLLGFSIFAFMFISIGLYYTYFSSSRLKYEVYSIFLLIISTIFIIVMFIDSRKNISELLLIIPFLQFLFIGIFNLKYVWGLDYVNIKQNREKKIKQKNDSKIVI